MLFRANVVNNGRYRYVIPSFEDDEKSSLVPSARPLSRALARVHKIYNGCTIHYCRIGGPETQWSVAREKQNVNDGNTAANIELRTLVLITVAVVVVDDDDDDVDDYDCFL